MMGAVAGQLLRATLVALPDRYANWIAREATT
ncbi:hypothetical protein LPU83_pLPU83d_0943 (plasmid) [Rhizobium favelukesii]|uniref:Uncharacterized protein n=1 Tax=Rhizobium favelukesii TaxID=348824 RepID=W6RUF2_9HYPH|nr:hypothetical protein LPU83_pLPU83d_0943 [Rhizobium favelukesii]